ncbi:hypothetical protein M8542_03280 [Amycolatopsis sp. OK19-0408]|uniref:Uncharacterized protein n=1 Tax=Amycolatopsis iheyensis TaxID=2945988 RepID=A0A9X2N3W4_9PSEU|nr:hypothetical protein [Amycolatopsis iheyensis]MCR6481831.1 hypothetical protein [Amycolatopsis iheyensis]
MRDRSRGAWDRPSSSLWTTIRRSVTKHSTRSACRRREYSDQPADAMPATASTAAGVDCPSATNTTIATTQPNVSDTRTAVFRQSRFSPS